MDSALLVHRIHFAFTVTFHYLFPQLTMGLAPLNVVLKTMALCCNDETWRLLNGPRNIGVGGLLEIFQDQDCTS